MMDVGSIQHSLSISFMAVNAKDCGLTLLQSYLFELPLEILEFFLLHCSLRSTQGREYNYPPHAFGLRLMERIGA